MRGPWPQRSTAGQTPSGISIPDIHLLAGQQTHDIEIASPDTQRGSEIIGSLEDPPRHTSEKLAHVLPAPGSSHLVDRSLRPKQGFVLVVDVAVI